MMALVSMNNGEDARVLNRVNCIVSVPQLSNLTKTRMWANAQRDGRPAEHSWRPLFNAVKFS